VGVGPAFTDPRILDFGSVPLDSESDVLLVTVRNVQQEDLVVTAVDIVGEHPQDFARETGCLPNVDLAADETCEIELIFSPTEVGERVAVLQISVTGGSGRQIRLVGSSAG
jgi:hypothetical protein